MFRNLTLSMLVAVAAVHAGLIADYQFNGNPNNSLAGPALTAEGAVTYQATTATANAASANAGFYVSNLLPDETTYTIAMRFQFDGTTGYRKIMDFKDRVFDAGFYVLNGALYFYNVSPQQGAFAANTLNDVVIRRSGGTVTAWTRPASGGTWDGFSFADGTNLGVFNPDKIWFFVDDGVQGSERASTIVDRIMIYDTGLDISQIDLGAASSPAVPEPGTLSLLMLAGVALGIRKFRS